MRSVQLVVDCGKTRVVARLKTSASGEDLAKARTRESESRQQDDGDNSSQPPEHAREAIIPIHNSPRPGTRMRRQNGFY